MKEGMKQAKFQTLSPQGRSSSGSQAEGEAGTQTSTTLRVPVSLVRYGNALRQETAVWAAVAD